VLKLVVETSFDLPVMKFLLYLGVDVQLADPKTVVGENAGLSDNSTSTSLFFDGKCIRYVDYELRKWDEENDTFYQGQVTISCS